MTDLEIATEQLYKLQNRIIHPMGSFNNAGRWYPDLKERRICCDNIRYPSRSCPLSYMKHCRSVVHVAHFYGVDVSALRKSYNSYKKERETNEQQSKW